MSARIWHGAWRTLSRDALALSACAAWCCVAHAGALTDGSVGAVQALSGHFTVPESLGKRTGSNLFQSFSRFSIDPGESATFTTSTSSIRNVITRVTGGEASYIHGPLSLRAAGGAHPDFFFVNPAGVVFGAGAQIDVPAGFAVSTAQQMKFSDGSVWITNAPARSVLSAAPPQAFGFLGSTSAASVLVNNIDGNGSPSERTALTTKGGSPMTIAAGAVQFASADVSASHGDLSITTTGDAKAEVPIRGAGVVPLVGSLEADDATLSTTGAGAIALAGGRVALRNGAVISANAGGVAITADTFALSGGASVSTATGGASRGGDIHVSAAQTRVEQLAKITAESTGKGDAGDIALSGASLTVASGGRIEAGTAAEGKGGSITVTMTGDVSVKGISADGQTRSGLFAKTQSPGGGTGGGGGAGASGGGGNARPGASGGAARAGRAGNIAITATNLVLDGGAQIDSSTTSGAPGGEVTITAAENIVIAGSSTRLTSDATRGDGKGGSITLIAKNITVRENAAISALTGGDGDAGSIALRAADQLLVQSGGTVTTSTSGSGRGGTIVVEAVRVLLDGTSSAITSDTLRPFADLTVTINIIHPNDEDLVVLLDSPSGTRVALLSRVGGAGADFTDTRFSDRATKPITSGAAPFTGTFRPREPLAQLINEMAAGNWTLNIRDQTDGNVGTLQSWTLQIGDQTFRSRAGPRTIPDGGTLRSTISADNVAVPAVQGSGEASGIGGDVTVHAGSLALRDGARLSAISRGSGSGGTVHLQIDGDVSVSGGARIATDTLGSGAAGHVLIDARGLLLNAAEVSSNSSAASSGNAGNIAINLRGPLTLLDGAIVSSSTNSRKGAAGSIEAHAKEITVEGPSAILAEARENSSGQTGSLTLDATSALILSDGAAVSIRNDATVPVPSALTPTLLSVVSPNVTLKDAQITAASTGNVSASDIRVKFTDRLALDPSSITTSAKDGNGGAIDIEGNGLLRLDNSQITTSVTGLSGNGGDISISAHALVMETGFIQANTRAARASGGNVLVDVDVLLPDGNNVFVGGDEIFDFRTGVSGFNVIQAAAPNGVSGNLSITTPQLDISGSLLGLTIPAEFGFLGQDLCQIGTTSSFTLMGRGGLPPSGGDLIRPNE